LLHIVEYNGSEWRQNLWFRDRLRGDAALRASYQSLKEQVAARFPLDRARYTDAKSAFIAAIRATAPTDAA
jgi:GrpB-like predicted nucleotidyltransferase (UPF0157 family)